jgi:hypothetical protein
MGKAIRIAAVCLGIAALAVPSATVASDGPRGPKGVGARAKACAKLRKADPAAFRATYGPRHAMRRCARGDEPRVGRVRPSKLRRAVRACREELAQDPEAFVEKYSRNGKRRAAFRRCVITKLKESQGGGRDRGKDRGGEEGGSEA